MRSVALFILPLHRSPKSPGTLEFHLRRLDTDSTGQKHRVAFLAAEAFNVEPRPVRVRTDENDIRRSHCVSRPLCIGRPPRIVGSDEIPRNCIDIDFRPNPFQSTTKSAHFGLIDVRQPVAEHSVQICLLYTTPVNQRESGGSRANQHLCEDRSCPPASDDGETPLGQEVHHLISERHASPRENVEVSHPGGPPRGAACKYRLRQALRKTEMSSKMVGGNAPTEYGWNVRLSNENDR